MALQKSKTLSNGATGDYWRVTNATFNRETCIVSCNLALYTSQAVANSANKHLGLIKHFRFSVNPAELSGSIVALVYGRIRDLAETLVTTDALGNPIDEQPYDPDLAGAIDV